MPQGDDSEMAGVAAGGRHDPTRFAFGATAAIMTSMALIVGLGSVSSGKTGILSGLLIIAIADNLSDTLGIHIHEESRARGSAVRTSVTNYLTRLVVAGSFIVLVLALPLGMARVVSIVWGALLLSALTWLIASNRGAAPLPEVVRHLAVAVAVVALSQLIGSLIHGAF